MSGKDRLKRFAARHSILERAMYWYYRMINGKNAREEIMARKNTSLFDYKRLSSELPYYPAERVIDNNLYGNARALKDFADIHRDLKAYMEHGLFLGGIVHKDQFNWHFPKIITMSEMRRKRLTKALPHKEIIPVGPYIHYAEPLYNKAEMKRLKKEFGKILLVFPFHSMKNVHAQFNEDAFVKEIELRSRDFDTVFICLFYLDTMNEERVKPYRERGYSIITAGHRYDPWFISRQRTHIELADMTMSNSMGTQTGYCIYLKKPHYIFRQDISQITLSAKELKRLQESHGERVNHKVERERVFFARLFGNYSREINREQYRSTAEFWGFDDIKTKGELQSLF